LSGVSFAGVDVRGWNFRGQNLRDADFTQAALQNADFTDAWVQGADFGRELWAEQLYSTASYRDKDLSGVGLSSNSMIGWNLVGFRLTGAEFERANLTDANLAGADLRQARFWNANLSRANLEGSDLRGAWLDARDMKTADLSHADLRGALSFVPPRDPALYRNSIGPTGLIDGLQLLPDDHLVVRDDPLAVSVEKAFELSPGGTLELVLEDAEWTSTITPVAGLTPALAGKLALSLAKGVDAHALLGTPFNLFDWNTAPQGQFSSVHTPAGTLWDLSGLYSTGQVRLTAVHALGDVDGDGRVDLSDFGAVKTHFGGSATLLEGDLTGDGRVDLSDFGLLKQNFGAQAAAVPEPASAALLAAGAAGMALFGLRRLRRLQPR
jgi:hypothetical protein